MSETQTAEAELPTNEERAAHALGVKASEIVSVKASGKNLSVQTHDGLTYSVSESGQRSLTGLGACPAKSAAQLGIDLGGDAKSAVEAYRKAAAAKKA